MGLVGEVVSFVAPADEIHQPEKVAELTTVPLFQATHAETPTVSPGITGLEATADRVRDSPPVVVFGATKLKVVLPKAPFESVPDMVYVPDGQVEPDPVKVE